MEVLVLITMSVARAKPEGGGACAPAGLRMKALVLITMSVARAKPEGGALARRPGCG